MQSQPLVSVICLCYNQAPFVADALHSILDQTYANLEIIVCDDSSTDASVNAIREVIRKHPEIRFVKTPKNLGNCKAFNFALKGAKGEYVIDLAADDLLLSNRIEVGISDLIPHGRMYGIHYSNAELIDKSGQFIRVHDTSVSPSGDVYRDVIDRYFICPTSMMIRRDVLDHMGGYNESLTYEDFDFWVRSSRKYKYLYNPEVLVKKRVVRGSLSSEQFRLFNKHQFSTIKVCETILSLNKTKEENQILRKRLLYEIGQTLKSLNFHLVGGFVMVWIRSYFRNEE